MNIANLSIEALDEIKLEKERIAKEVIKEHLLEVERTEADIEAAKAKHEEAKKRFEELLRNRTVLLKFCLKRAASQPISKND